MIEGQQELLHLARNICQEDRLTGRLDLCLVYGRLLEIVQNAAKHFNYARAARLIWAERRDFMGEAAYTPGEELDLGIATEMEMTELAEKHKLFDQILETSNGHDLTIGSIADMIGIDESTAKRWYAARYDEPIAHRRKRLGRECNDGEDERDNMELGEVFNNGR